MGRIKEQVEGRVAKTSLNKESSVEFGEVEGGVTEGGA